MTASTTPERRVPVAAGARQPSHLARLALAVLATTLSASSAAQDSASSHHAPDTPEPGSIEAIARDTTEPRFSSPWVSYVPESAAVPSPSDHFGRIAGAASELGSSREIYAYLRALDAASPRVAVFPIGESWEGREILLVAIADEDGITRLDELKGLTAALADPRRTSPEQAEAMLSRARPFYYFNAALHADESGSPEAVMEMAYRLAVSEQPYARRIRENVVVLINPVSNPDGRDKMVDWFYRHLRGKTDFDELPRISPPYWGRYVFVDANRDAHQLSQPETQAVARMFFEYHPQVIHDLHEAIPLLLTWNGTGPYNPRLDPIVFAEFLEMSFHEVSTLTALGMPGVWTWDFGEGFGHHYLDSIAMNHNSLGRGYETFGNGTAETVKRVLDRGDSTSAQWFRPSPPPAEFRWSARDNVNYTQTAALAILDWSARHPDRLLRNFYRKGYNSWQRGVAGKPYAIAIPASQNDARRAAQLVAQLRRQGIEVHRVDEPSVTEVPVEGALTAGGRVLTTGSYVVRLDQPYRDYALDLLQAQEFPEKTERPPYDDVSWALPVHYGLEVIPVDDPTIRDAPLVLLEEDPRASGQVSGSGPWYVLADSGQESLLEARYRLSRFEVEVAGAWFSMAGLVYPPGSWLLRSQPGLEAELSTVADDLGLLFVSSATAPDVPRHELDPPRLGVLVPWADTDSIGWVRYTLDQRGVPYVYLRDDDPRGASGADLRERVDVILYGHVDLDLQGQIHGLATSTGPLAFTATERFPSHGVPAASEDITGGIGFAGLASLEQFVKEGGLLIALGRATRLALEGGLVRSVRLDHDGAHTPGAELRARFVRPEHPLAYGYTAETSFFRGLFESWDEPRRWLRMAYCTGCLDGPLDPRYVVARWGGATPGADLVVSGGARNEQDLVDRPAILSVPVGKGHVVAVNFNPLHRDLNRSDHRVVWNAVLNWNDL